jgi:hypothetical protein
MRYELRLTAYDMLDQVHVSVWLSTLTEDDPPQHRAVGAYAATVAGSGESDPSVWTRDALVAALEALP